MYLSVLARSSTTSLGEVAAAMYERRSLVRWLAMRRTVFLVPYDDVPLVQAAAGDAVAATLRTRLTNQLERNGTDPPIDGDAATWVDSLARRTEQVLRQRGRATGVELGDHEPGLRTRILARAASDRPQKVTTSLLTMLGAQGRIVRSTPTGAWTSRHHTWEHADEWWPDGFPVLDVDDAQRELARRWLRRFGPATVEDLRWWTGWNKSTVGRALAALPIEEVDLHGTPGIDLPPDESDGVGGDDAQPPGAALLPALDATAMGWKHREWYLAVEPDAIFDRGGNIGPSVWWDGEIIGSLGRHRDRRDPHRMPRRPRSPGRRGDRRGRSPTAGPPRRRGVHTRGPNPAGADPRNLGPAVVPPVATRSSAKPGALCGPGCETASTPRSARRTSCTW